MKAERKALRFVGEDESEQFGQRVENGLEFAREILNDPTILEHIPTGSKVDAVFKEQRDAAEHYDIETRRMVGKVTPPSQPAE